MAMISSHSQWYFSQSTEWKYLCSDSCSISSGLSDWLLTLIFSMTFKLQAAAGKWQTSFLKFAIIYLNFQACQNMTQSWCTLRSQNI